GINTAIIEIKLIILVIFSAFNKFIIININAIAAIPITVFVSKPFNSSDSIGSVGYKLSFDKYFLPSNQYCNKPKNIPIAAKEKPKWKLTLNPNCPTTIGETKTPTLIPKTKILNPASLRGSFEEYKLPTISDTLGFNKPVPKTIKIIDKSKAPLPYGVDNAI